MAPSKEDFATFKERLFETKLVILKPVIVIRRIMMITAIRAIALLSNVRIYTNYIIIFFLRQYEMKLI